MVPLELRLPPGEVLPHVGPVEVDVPCAGGDAVQYRFCHELVLDPQVPLVRLELGGDDGRPATLRRFPDDSVLLIDRDLTTRAGQAACIELSDGSRIVRTIGYSGKRMLLVPDSFEDGYSVMELDACDAAKVLGTVVWYQATI